MSSQNIFWNGQWYWLSWTFRTCCTLCVSAMKSWSCWYSSDLPSNFGERIFLWLSSCNLLCSKWSLWSWRYAPSAHSCMFLMEKWAPLLWLCLCWKRSFFSRFSWFVCCTSDLVFLILISEYTLSMCFNLVVQYNWRGTLSTHWHVDGRTRVWWKWGESCECYSLG